MKITSRQQEILDYIKDYINENHYPPSIRDIAGHFSLASAGGVHKHLNNLKRKGFITFENNISRSIQILSSESFYPERSTGSNQNTRLIELPLMGKVAAGQPIQHFLENETMEFPESMIRKPDKSYVLRVQGDSMIEECICDGDYLIVEHRNYAENGNTVIAMINHKEATVKKFYHEKERIRLQPANHTMEPIYVDPRELSIHGVVVGVLRHY
ncbi:transcriptional repressor LexA [bacterium]|nr:transcriptional repressor LexA [bacterium]